MANLLQSTQVKTSCAPSFYTDYLSNLAKSGQQAQQAAQFVGAQPLQEKAFQQACQGFGTYQPALTAGQGYIGQAAGQNITGAATPYLQAGTTASPLCAARPMICQAANLNLACVASQYMSPYIRTAVQSLSDIGQRNIRQNLSPMATAAAVGSGQYGSQRGAQVLGQVQAQAEQDLNNQIAQMLSSGYGQALQAAQSKQGALTSAAQQIAQAQQAQNQAQLQAAQTAGSTAAQQAQALQQAGLGMGTLGAQCAQLRLACINALGTLGAQQQAILQNQQNYPLTTLGSLAGLLQGYSVPVGTTTRLDMSPFSALAAIGSGGLGVLQNLPGIKASLGNLFSGAGGGANPINPGQGINDQINNTNPPNDNTNLPSGWENYTGCYGCCCSAGSGPFCRAKGGSIQAKSGLGCASTKSLGALPARKG